MSFLIPDAFAQTAAGATQAAPGMSLNSFLFLFVFIGIFYFLLWRPQNKRAKEHRQLLANIAVGDEVIVNGGFVGTIAKIVDEQFVKVSVANGVEMTIQKPAITAVLPKGTLKSLQ